MRTGTTIRLIKIVHTVLFAMLSWSVVYVLYSGIANRLTRWTAIAMTCLVAEGFVLVRNAWKCPLTAWAERLGAVNGGVAHLFLPRFLARRLFGICAPIYVIACAIIVIRLLTS